MKISEYTTSLVHVSTMVVSWMMMITFIICWSLSDGDNIQRAFVILGVIFGMMSLIWTIISFDGMGKTSHIQRVAELLVKIAFSKDVDTDDDLSK